MEILDTGIRDGGGGEGGRGGGRDTSFYVCWWIGPDQQAKMENKERCGNLHITWRLFLGPYCLFHSLAQVASTIVNAEKVRRIR